MPVIPGRSIDMSLHSHSVPVARERSVRRAARDDDAPRAGMPAALATWLAWHDFPDPYSRGVDGLTPLMLAALQGEDSVVNALLADGARVDALDDAGNNALWYACVGGAPAPVLRLIGAGIDVDHANDDDITCLMQAAASGRVEVMQLLLAQGACDTLCAPDGRTALDMAADRGLQLLHAARRLGGRGTGAAGEEHAR
jgi:hypothetical protein